ncbi:SDR family NAD(P)-dependent oxidoreductase [Paenibacillus sp. PL91]|uniref:SDR family NAD(P)-dependent oxidoreductase n=1 Tax=Paenibacillus sp. PL91 TaxID=2729538 RepID=UPI00145E1B3C|nr:SDR family NAD(P)-dependent oxidoreductase [Paenibacillus sp. PL91]MBC9202864.1 SDR family oxidoreductase [Paenibacillus sp. PL91]
MVNPMDLTGKRILVTGASSGIGRAVAIQLSKLGAIVALVARSSQRLQETLEQMEGTGHQIFPFDLTDIDGIEGWIKKTVSEFGSFNGLAHCAGIGPMRPLQMTNFAFLNNVMTINFYAFIEIVRMMSRKKYYEEGASFVAISSIMSKQGDKTTTAYCASKGALDSSIRPLAKELALKKIRVNSVIPGFIRTNMYTQYADTTGESEENQIISRQYLGIGEPTDVANAIAYLLSDASKFITGTGLAVDGGYLS